MIIKLPENLAAEIRVRAAEQGRDPETYVIGLLWRGVVELDPPKPKGRKTRKAAVTEDVADHDWSDIFKFSDPTENRPTIEDLRRPVNVSNE
ncbi:MAG: hypothetical protein JNL21_38655 [Myxococcales bacterium]|nr:hypothetical protein [Myxococcales bacterium]